MNARDLSAPVCRWVPTDSPFASPGIVGQTSAQGWTVTVRQPIADWTLLILEREEDK